jgi:hypothetical protein
MVKQQMMSSSVLFAEMELRLIDSHFGVHANEARGKRDEKTESEVDAQSETDKILIKMKEKEG